jgi:haloalkane dehalogenase
VAQRDPHVEPHARWSLAWPRELPINGEPEDVVEIVASYSKWLSESEIPKLFVNAEPGTILAGAQRKLCRSWPNQREVTVRGSYFVQEDSPARLGRQLPLSSPVYKEITHYAVR